MSQFKTQLSSATLVCLDGNIPTSTINYVCCFAEKRNINGNQWKDMILKNLKNVLLLIVTLRFPCVSQFGMNRPTQKRLVSLSFQMPGSLCPIHLQTWQSCAPWIKHWVSKHLKVNYVSSFISESHQKTNSHPLLLMLELLSKMQILWRKLRMWFCIAAVLPSTLDETLSVAVALSRPLLEHLHCLVVTLGANGVLLCGEYDEGTVNLQPRKQKRVRMVFMPACNDLLWQ